MTMKTRAAITASAYRTYLFYGPDDDKYDFDKQLGSEEESTETKEDTNDDPPKQKKEKDKFELMLEDHPDEEEEEEKEEEEEEKQEEEEEEKEEEEEDPKKKNTKEESNKILRKQRDELQEKLKAYGDVTPELASAFNEFLQERFKDSIPTADELKGEFLLVADKDAEIERLKTEIQEKDNQLSDIDIRMSPEFKKKYTDPYAQAGEALFLEISNLSQTDGKALAPAETQAFYDKLLKMEKLDGVAVKQELTRFAAEFKRQTGEDYISPPVSAVMTSLRQLHERRSAMNEAYSNWGQTKSKAIADRQKEQEQQEKDIRARNERLRKKQAQDAMRSFDRSQLDGFVDDDKFVSTFNKEFQYVESFMKDPTKTPAFSELITRGWKARMFDELLEDWKKLKRAEEEAGKKKKNGSRGGGGDTKNEEEEEDWSGGRL